ncbi:MAG: YdiU family protein [Verrucomicrobiaceae bacterium]|nr:YdiU family protein [Verrucomicrobiaceae bacterium]
MQIPFNNTYAQLPGHFYARVLPEQAPSPRLIRINEELAQQLHIDPEWLRGPEGLAMLSGNSVSQGSEPLAQAYAGHQFGNFVPQLGDGRAILLGEITDTQGRHRDLQLKGSGRTPFSRNGDGKAALGPALREYLVSEAMYALGIPTTRALAVVATGEEVARQEGMLDGAVFARVASSHLRVGTFQYFAARQDVVALEALTRFALQRHFPEALAAENPALALLEQVIEVQGSLIPRWMGLGFIHGVMNTDNCSISGETIDYGPCAFMDSFHPKCVYSAIDRGGRYSWGNQPGILVWNLTRLAETLLPLISKDDDEAETLATNALDRLGRKLGDNYHQVFSEKLGLPTEGRISRENDAFIRQTLTLLASQEVDFTHFFRRLTQTVSSEEVQGSNLAALFKNPSAFAEWNQAYQQLTAPSGARIDAMRHSNPVLIPRNHRIEEAIQAAYQGDFVPFHRLADAWQRPFEDNPDYADLQAAPEPHEIVRQTFCGT